MTEIDRTELHELRERVQGAAADRELIAEQLRHTLATNRELETQLQQITQHRDRLLGEKERIWGDVLRADPDTARATWTTSTSSVATAFPGEQARVRAVLAECRRVGAPGLFAAVMLEDLLRRADTAIASGDVLAILRTYTEMTEVKA